MSAFNPKKPMFPAKEQLAVINDSPEFIAMMRGSKDIEEWNANRDTIKNAIKRTNRRHYFMLMGHIDTSIFRETFK